MSYQQGKVYGQSGPNQQYGYPSQTEYPPQHGYPSQSGYPPQQGYPPQSGYPQGQGAYSSYQGFAQSGFQQPGYQPPMTNFDDEEGAKNFSFDDQSVRKAFIKKVYSILMIQLIITFGIVSIFAFIDGVRNFAQANIWIIWVAFAIIIVTMICMACCEKVRRTTPMNYIFLLIFTLAESFMLGILCATYSPDAVLLAIGITAAVCLGLTIFAWQTKWDFTACGGALIAMLIIFMIFGIFALIFNGPIMNAVYSSIGVMIFSLYLIYDTQLMMGGKHKYSISPEEYIFASLNLYLDIINLFIYILSLVGGRS